MNDRCDLGIFELAADSDQRWKTRGRSTPVCAMTDAALAAVDGLTRSSCRLIRCKAARPCHFVGIDIDDPGHGIDSWSTPFRSAIKPRKYDCLLVQPKRDE